MKERRPRSPWLHILLVLLSFPESNSETTRSKEFLSGPHYTRLTPAKNLERVTVNLISFRQSTITGSFYSNVFYPKQTRLSRSFETDILLDETSLVTLAR